MFNIFHDNLLFHSRGYIKLRPRSQYFMVRDIPSASTMPVVAICITRVLESNPPVPNVQHESCRMIAAMLPIYSILILILILISLHPFHVPIACSVHKMGSCFFYNVLFCPIFKVQYTEILTTMLSSLHCPP